MADTDYIAHLTGNLREIVVACYLAGLNHTYRKLFVSTVESVVLLLTHISCFSWIFPRCCILWLVHSKPPIIDIDYIF
jgi:hypothetical protein